MDLIAGIDIGNSSTEVALLDRTGPEWTVVASSLYRTTGLKGTIENVPGIRTALERAVEKVDVPIDALDRLLLNEAAPVIGDVAMETITETVVTESTMIGHDPSTPGGVGLGSGIVVEIGEDPNAIEAESVVVLVPEDVDFASAADVANDWCERGIDVQGVIMQNDDGVLVANRTDREIPIVDEVREIDAVPIGQPAAVEVAPSGRTIEQLSNPYGIATIFDLSPDETKKII
ncbi:MAG: diol dehydratase reactivase subunit alpha, partial [Halalkalicoccus sp.]|nr:diol dehydratase reactivase subunit alpha [Halalkalicoccus sp.]